MCTDDNHSLKLVANTPAHREEPLSKLRLFYRCEVRGYGDAVLCKTDSTCKETIKTYRCECGLFSFTFKSVWLDSLFNGAMSRILAEIEL